MLKCNGHKMFHGTVRVTPPVRGDGTRWTEPFDRTGTWLFNPDRKSFFRVWLCRPDGCGLSEQWHEDTLSDFRDDDGTEEEEILNG